MLFMLPPRRVILADGSGNNQGAQAAIVRALDAGAALRRCTTRLLDELDNDITEVHGPKITDLDQDDSAVIVVDEALATLRKNQ